MGFPILLRWHLIIGTGLRRVNPIWRGCFNTRTRDKCMRVPWLFYLYNGNCHTWKDSLYIETWPRFGTSKILGNNDKSPPFIMPSFYIIQSKKFCFLFAWLFSNQFITIVSAWIQRIHLTQIWCHINPCHVEFILIDKDVLAFSISTQHWSSTGSWKHSSPNTSTGIPCIVNTNSVSIGINLASLEHSGFSEYYTMTWCRMI